MPWEWVAPAGTTALGLAGIAATYFGARRSADAARDAADKQGQALLQAQREERHQRRLEQVYPAMLDAVVEGNDWAWKVDAFITNTDVSAKCPREPESVQRIARQGQLGAVQSPRVSQLVVDYWLAAGRISGCGTRLEHLWQREGKTMPARTGEEIDFTFEDFEAGRMTFTDYLDGRFQSAHRELTQAADQLREQAWRELRGEDDGRSN